MLSDHHAFIDVNAGSHEKHPTILQPVERVSGSKTVAIGDKRTAGPLRYLSLVRHVTVKEGVHHDGAAGLGQHLATQADEAAAGHAKLQTNPTVTVIVHLKHLPASRPEALNHGPDKIIGYVNCEMLHWFLEFAIDRFGNNLGPAHHQLKAFTTHHLDQDGQLQLS